MRQVAHRHAPGLVNRSSSARQGNIGEVGGALEASAVGNQNFPAPNLAIGAVSGAVERKTDDFALEMVLRHAAGNMRVMMLNTDEGRVLLARPPGGEVVGMKIVGDDLRAYFEDSLKMRDRLFEEFIALQIFQISEVLTQEGVLALGEADGVLQFAAHGEDGGHFLAQKHRNRNKTARTPELLHFLWELCLVLGSSAIETSPPRRARRLPRGRRENPNHRIVGA